MIQAKIVRVDATPSDGTLGVFLVDGVAQCVSVEPYHRQNRVGLSSIPAGQYICRPYKSDKYPETWEITGIEGRSEVLFHTGNLDQDSRGCIIFGSEFGDLKTEHGVLESKKAFARIKGLIPANKIFRLTIVECY